MHPAPTEERRSNPEAPTAGSPPPDDAVDPLDLLIIMVRCRRMRVAGPLLAAVVAAGVSLILPNTYTGVTSILPPQQLQSGAAAMLSQIGGLASAASGALGSKSPSDLCLTRRARRSGSPGEAPGTGVGVTVARAVGSRPRGTRAR